MKKIKIIIALATIITSTACHKDSLWGIRGKGNTVTNTISATGFDKINLDIDAEVNYIQDSSYSVEISAQQNIQSVLEVTVEAGMLKIGTKRNLWDHKTIHITIHSPSIYAFYINGKGKISVTGVLITNSLKMDVSGSGDIFVQSVTTQTLSGKISGSGNIHVLGGVTTNETFYISGSGNMDVLAVQSDNTIVNVSGSGDLKTWVMQSLTVTISGSGSVSYKGYPSVSTDISGSGKVIHIN